jgi:hypothetical protein
MEQTKPVVVSSEGQVDYSSSVSMFVGSVIIRKHDTSYQTLTGRFYKCQFQWGRHWKIKNERVWRS